MGQKMTENQGLFIFARLAKTGINIQKKMQASRTFFGTARKREETIKFKVHLAQLRPCKAALGDQF